MGEQAIIDDAVDGVTESLRPVRILFVVDSKFPGPGGAESQARKLARSLMANHNATVEFVSPQVVKDMPVSDSVDGLPNHRVSYFHIKYIGAVLLMLHFAWYLFKRRNDFDVVHVHITRLLATVAVLMRPITGLPVIAKISGYFEFSGGVLDPDGSVGNIPLRWVLRRLDYVQTISVQTRERLLQAGFSEQQIKFVPNGIDSQESIRLTTPEAGDSDKDPNALVFGYCGRLREIKGVELLVDGFADLVANNPGRAVKLRIAGGGTLFESLTQKIQALGLNDCIEMLGTVDNTHAFYRTLDVYVQPSFAEGLPNSVIEAMVAKLPVLATNIGGNKDLVTHESEGWLFEAGDTAGLTQLMQRCIDEQDKLTTFGQQGQQRIIETYDFSSVTEDLMELYRGQ